jgi:hypothetical protein
MPDKNHISICSEIVGERAFGVLQPPDDSYADTLKITGGSRDGVIKIGVIFGGREDCLDVNNHAENIEVIAGEWRSGGKYVATIKGHSRRITLRGVSHRPGRVCDVEIGNWSDQCGRDTGPVFLDLTRADGRPVCVRLFAACNPILPGGGPYEIKRIPRVLLRGYALLKFLHLV